MNFDLQKLSKTWLAIAIGLVAANIAGLVSAIIFMKKSWVEMLIVAAVVIVDLVAYNLIKKKLTPTT